MIKRIFKILHYLPAVLALGAAIFTCVQGFATAVGKSSLCCPHHTELKPTHQGDIEGTEAAKRRPEFAAKIDLPSRRQKFSTPPTQQLPDSKTNKHNVRPGEPAPKNEAQHDQKPLTELPHYTYEFSQAEFYIPHIVIEHDASGRGQITFKRLNEETPIVETLEISPAALARISAQWEALRFLDSDINYQSSKQFPHLGTMRITMAQGTRKRVAEFNWTNNTDASALVNEYRRVADQAIFVFDMSVARENQPLNAPKLMEQLESMLKRNWLSDPQQLTPLLKEISTDEHLPLIARNHALRLLKKIEK